MAESGHKNILDIYRSRPGEYSKIRYADQIYLGHSPGIHFLGFTYDGGEKQIQFAMSAAELRVLKAQIETHLDEENASIRAELRREWQDAAIANLERQAKQTRRQIEEVIDSYAKKESCR